MRTHTFATALALLCASRALGAVPEDARAYQAARKGYYALKTNAGKGQGREAWTRAAARFEQVAKTFPGSDRAPLALYTAGELRNQLSRVSLAASDRQAARRDYEQVASRYRKSQLADDALYQIARIAFDRENDSRGAREALTDLLERYPRSDMAPRAKKLLASIPESPTRVLASASRPESRPEPRPEPRPAENRASPAPAPIASQPASDPKGTAQDEGDADDADDDDDGDEKGPVSVDEPLKEAKASPADAAQAKASTEPMASTDPMAEPMAEPKGEPGASPTPEPTEIPSPVGQTKPSKLVSKPTREWHGLLDALRKVGPAPGGVPLAVQMGLRVRRIVIDPGHGGHDSGAIGPGGTREKDVTLAVAQKLAQDLRSQGLEVLLSRNDDRFVALEDRASFANQAKADLFISIHCNAARDRKLRGTETYFLNVTDDRYALRLAARENQASEKSLSDLQMILADMATKADVEESERLAREVQRTLADGSRDPSHRDLGVKHALFYVLLGTKMPSVLVETAFLSNPDDERKLRSDKYQSELAHSIAQGVGQFLDQRQGFANAVP